ncbi:hypothetical protein LTR37_019873 [Vermiconidia calcicola]|uniref:Uncharacterized protein n=1 Tax=Vermiconidia calcicola TaxID=1690605 RepID=A0ACC3MCW3_9PEZI|nr:hypothetical protein LTR37_019873 [Vermiconidia calcicola]
MPSKPKNSKKPQPSVKSSNSNALNKQPTPDWPPLTPVLPAEDLTLESLLDDQVLTIPRLWTASLCKAYVSFCSALPLATTPGKPKRGDAVRVNDRFQVNDPSFAERLWSSTGLKQIVENPAVGGRVLTAEETQELWGGEVSGLNGNIRIYRYSKGQFFDQHYDDSNNLMFPSADSPTAVPAKTTWTLLLYLTSPATGCIGGETVFHPDQPSKWEAAPPPIVAELEVGMALLHRHGKDCLLHEGREVTAGEKWIIRSDLRVKR